MNGTRKSIVLLAVLVVGAGAWWGRRAWRAHHHLVTLHVRNVPLAEVVKSIERQTWQDIRFDKRLNARITLNLVDAPLTSALDAVAAKAGGRWRITHAVGASQQSWSRLESALESGSDVVAAGWTNLAPRFDGPPPPPPGDADGDGDGPKAILPPVAAGDGAPPGARLRRIVGSRDGGGERVVTISGDGKVDQWSPERLILESRLAAQLGSASAEEATSEAAAQTAAAVHGEARTYYALEKAPFGMGGGNMRFGRRGPGPPGGLGGKNGPGPALPGDFVANLMAEQQQRRLQELGNSPEEQVEQARQRAANGGQMRFQTIDTEK